MYQEACLCSADYQEHANSDSVLHERGTNERAAGATPGLEQNQGARLACKMTPNEN